MDLIGKIYPASSKGNNFILVATKVLHQIGRCSTIEESRVKECDLIHQGIDHS